MRISEGEVIPRGYGVAYRDLIRHEAVVLPIPVNWVAGIANRALWLARQGVDPTRAAIDYADARAHREKLYQVRVRRGLERHAQEILQKWSRIGSAMIAIDTNADRELLELVIRTNCVIEELERERWLP